MQNMTKKLLLIVASSAIVVALLAILLALETFPCPPTANTDQSSTHIVENLAEIRSTMYDFVSLIERTVSRSHHRHDRHRKRRKTKCDPLVWNSPLVAEQNAGLLLTVDLNGCGNFTSLQKAIDAVPDYSLNRTLIIVNAGVYREKVVVWTNKTNITIQGQGYLNTCISWNDSAKTSKGTAASASFSVFAFNFRAYNLSFVNAYGRPPPQAVALRVRGDQAAFYNCGFYGYQDTLLDERGLHYFRDCFIQGSIDFIYGNGRSIYENCTINTVANPPKKRGGITGYITAQGKESALENSGFSFVNCSIGGTGNVLLGRAWGAYSTVVFSRTYMSRVIDPKGWDDFRNSSKDQDVFYGEYECSGPGANTAQRVLYAKQLGECEAVVFMDIAYINGTDWVLSPRVNDEGKNPCRDHRRTGNFIEKFKSSNEVVQMQQASY